MRRRTSAYRFVAAGVAVAFLAACGQSELPDDASTPPPAVARAASAKEALQGAHVRTLDPTTLRGAEVRKVIGARPHCTFRYTGSGHPVVVAGLRQDGSAELGVIKLNNQLVPLQPEPSTSGQAAAGFVLSSEPVRVSVRPLPNASASEHAGAQRVEADMIFEVGQELKVGYGGFLECRTAAPSLKQEQ
ncbi:hypothetical protein JI739_19405 [Ramlibacter sp. AW1]|uniref:Lipoprotein n=1 Tax=Ramlibacter aurantiacus TaxID=2801330 RepID=A0A936ZMJ5_9BURK|nr:hypothetical protein [Ramlibacter aurantiacus]MBL0422522.1 hypothetical protein [Ramlibacter aurantiacus]